MLKRLQKFEEKNKEYRRMETNRRLYLHSEYTVAVAITFMRIKTFV